MSLPQKLLSGISPGEVEFLAEATHITVVPNFRSKALEFSSGTYGPFKPLQQVQVPLWLALTLLRRKRCRLIPPPWLAVDFLEKRLEEEITEPGFSKLHPRYLEIGYLLIDGTSQAIESPERVRRLLQDLREARQAKARQGLHGIDGRYLQVDDLSIMEVNEIRPVVSEAFDFIRRFEPPSYPNDEGVGAAPGGDDLSPMIPAMSSSLPPSSFPPATHGAADPSSHHDSDPYASLQSAWASTGDDPSEP